VSTAAIAEAAGKFGSASSLKFPDDVFLNQLGQFVTEATSDGHTFPVMAKQDLLKLPSHFELEPILQEQLSSRPGHQRCMEGTIELLLVLHEVPQPGNVDREAWFFWKRSDGRWTQPGGPGINEVSELLARYEATIADHQKGLELTSAAAEIFAILRHASPLSLSARNLVQALEQALAFEPDDRDIRSLRDRARELERAADLLHADARIHLEFWTVQHHEEQLRAVIQLGKTGNRLFFLIGFFLPLVALAGIFGMNTNLPGYMLPLFLGIVIAGLVLWLINSQQKTLNWPPALLHHCMKLRQLTSTKAEKKR